MKKSIEQYKQLLGAKGLLIESSCSHKDIEYVSCNSKDIKKNTLFICKGASFKKEYLEDAIASGVTIYISNQKYDVNCDYILVNDIRKAMVYCSELYHDKVWNNLSLIGITGTKGKSTTAFFVRYMIDEYLKQNGKVASGILSSIASFDGKEEQESHITTPEPIDLHNYFSKAYNNGVEFVEMEVSSQALKYDRVLDVDFEVAAFLNIGEDHISDNEHVDFEDYFSSKLEIFKQSKVACVNTLCEFYDRVYSSATAHAKKVITFGVEDKNADVQGYNIQKDGNDTVFMVKTDSFNLPFRLTIPGLFNVDNALAAISICLACNIPVECMQAGLEKARVNGRMEIYQNKDASMIGIVDYAHNKLSFEKLFQSTRKEFPDYRIVIVFGCPGFKALNRRQDLGTMAGRYADITYITEDDPAKEPIVDICNEIARYVDVAGGIYEIIYNRQDAIEKAVLDSTEKTVVLVAAKGNETVQKRADGFASMITDREAIIQSLQKYDETNNI